jgi:tetratricopeptide (TPR) repeat protein
MASLYRACDVFVSPYRGEGFCLPALEAMACGLPVIVTDGGATDDFVDEFVGWKIDSKPRLIPDKAFTIPMVKDAYWLEPDENSLIKIFEDIVNNPNYIKHLGYVASYKARKFWTWEKSTLKIYTRLDYLYDTNLARDYAAQIKEVDDDYAKVGEAEYCINIGETDKAFSILDEIKEPKLANYVQLVKAMLYTQEGNFEEVEEIVSQLNYEENKFDIDYLKILKFLSEENLVDAIETLNPLVNDWQSYKWQTNYVISLDFLINMVGDIIYMMQDYEYAEKIYDSGIELNPSNVSLLIGKAKCKFNLGKSEDAMLILNKLKDDYPDFEEIDDLISEMEEYQD